MLAVDKALAKTIRPFEMDSHFFHCEPLKQKGSGKEAQGPTTPRTPPPTASPPATKVRTHLVPPPSGTARYWSGATGSEEEAAAFPLAVFGMASGDPAESSAGATVIAPGQAQAGLTSRGDAGHRGDPLCLGAREVGRRR